MNKFFIFALALLLSASVSYAGHGGENCPMDAKGDIKTTVMEGSKALESSNPELAGKLKKIAEQCCSGKGMHDKV